MSRVLRATAVLMPLALLASGCLFESTLDPSGGGTIKARYKVAKDQTLEQQKKSFTSANMTVEKATLSADHVLDIEAAFKDVTKLSSSAIFKAVQVAVTSDAEAGTKTLLLKQVNRNPAKLPQSAIDYFGDDFTLSITLPGEIVKSNATSTKGNTATWKLTLTKLLADKEVPFEVTYRAPADAATTPGATPPAAAATPAK